MPRNIIQFQKGLGLHDFLEQYGTEEQCRQALYDLCWPTGYVLRSDSFHIGQGWLWNWANSFCNVRNTAKGSRLACNLKGTSYPHRLSDVYRPLGSTPHPPVTDQ